MPAVLIRFHVDEQGRITGQVPPSVPPGDYTASLELPKAAPEQPAQAPRQLDWPVHDSGPWPAELSLRRENLYGGDGR